MDQKLAVLFMPDDMTLTKEQTPLMLRPILFCPILTWMVEELMGRGIERFFIVSDKRAHDMMRPYVPENADVVYVDGARHGEELLTLLKDEKGSVLIVNGAVLPVGVFSGGAVYSADAKECCKVLKEHGAFAAFPKGAEITKGFLPVGDDEELRSAARSPTSTLPRAFPSWTPTIPTLTPASRSAAARSSCRERSCAAGPSSARTAPSARTP